MFGLTNRKHKPAPRIAEALAGTYTPEELAAIDQYGTLIELAPGATMIVEGAFGQEVLLIVEGSAAVSRDEDIIAHVGAGDLVGETAILTGERRNATLIATTKVAVMVFNSREFRSLLQAVPSLATAAEALVASRS